MPDLEPLDPDVVFHPLPSEDAVEPSFGEYFTAAAGNVLRDSPTSSFMRGVELSIYEPGAGKASRIGPRKLTSMSAEDASARAKAAGVEVDFGDGPTTREGPSPLPWKRGRSVRAPPRTS